MKATFKINMNKPFMKREIGELKLNTRAEHILKRSRIFTIPELIDNIPNLKNAKGMGVKTYDSILTAIFNFYVSNLTDKEEESFTSTITFKEA